MHTARARATLAHGLAALFLAFPAAGPARAAAPSDAIAAGDSAYATGDLAAAHAAYLTAAGEGTPGFGLLWRLARTESERGEDAKGEVQRRLVSTAVDHARAAVKSAPDSALGHLWLAVALGRQALKEGAKTRLSLSREIKSEVERAITIDPGIGRAYHVRAMWNRRLASLNAFERAVANTVLGGVPRGASVENALADFARAIELEPAYVNHRLELGRTYIQLKRWDEARAELERALSLPATSNPRDPRYQQEARELLGRLPRQG